MIAMIILFLIVLAIVYMFGDCGIKGSAVLALIISVAILWSTFRGWGYDIEESADYQVPCDDIYSLNITTEVSGTFVVGCGTIDSNAYYTFYTKDNNDLYRMSKVAVDGTLIKLDSSQSPKLIKVARMITKTPCTIFGGTKESYEHSTGERILVVPSNTIRQEYKVN